MSADIRDHLRASLRDWLPRETLAERVERFRRHPPPGVTDVRIEDGVMVYTYRAPDRDTVTVEQTRCVACCCAPCRCDDGHIPDGGL